MSALKSPVYEVQTHFTYGWENVWRDTSAAGVESPTRFPDEQEALDAIHEFFADLGVAGMAQLYDLEDYRVREVSNES